jgi:hypothetical protein
VPTWHQSNPTLNGGLAEVDMPQRNIPDQRQPFAKDADGLTAQEWAQSDKRLAEIDKRNQVREAVEKRGE